MNWDDLRVVQAVYRTGSFAAAGARLKINETTVARRLERLERDLGERLFDAMDGARRPNPRCEEIIGMIESMSDQAAFIEKAASPVAGLTGRRRIATTDSIAADLIAPRIGTFLSENPGLSLDLLASTENVNFSRWEADLAVRLGKPDRGNFAIRKLAELDLFLIEPATSREAFDPVLCAFPEELDHAPEAQYLKEIGLKSGVRVRTKNYLVLKQLIQSKRCAAILPSFMCGALLKDSNFKATQLSAKREVWLLLQEHLKEDLVTRKVIDWIVGALNAANSRQLNEPY